MTLQEQILAKLPYGPPFHFVDRIMHVNEESIEGSFYLRPDLDFYQGHFADRPVTPGVILTEIMAQIGLVCLGIYLSLPNEEQHAFALSSTEVEFLKPVLPGETVRVQSKKIYFRFGKLKCNVVMYNAKEEQVCAGTIAGILIKNNHD